MEEVGFDSAFRNPHSAFPAIGVVGASARAAVMSLARAGYDAWAVDLFCDRDLKRIAPCVRCPFADFPEALPDLADRFPPGPVLYTGGLENYPDVVGELARRRPLWGNGPEALRRVRDPFRSEPDAQAREFTRTPAAHGPGSTIPISGRWLVKSMRSSGGLGVRSARPGEIIPQGHYAQEFIPGPSMSAVFQDRELLGITEQLIGAPWLHAKPFHYAGTLHEPDALPERGALAPRAAVKHGGLTSPAREVRRAPVFDAPGLVGYFGIDFILNDDTSYVIEVNPRYPASLEVIEHAKHLGAAVGKAIYFAPHAFRFPETGPWDADLTGPFDPWRLPTFADIPEPGEPMEPGSPVLTFFASGSSAEVCREKLQARAAELDGLLK